MHRDTGKILVVEDDLDTRLILQRHLREAGLVTHTVENGAAALAFLERMEVDLILLDLMMPVMDGFTLMQELRGSGARAGLPVVVLSAMDLSSEDRNRLRRPGELRGYKSAEIAGRLREVLEEHFRARSPAT